MPPKAKSPAVRFWALVHKTATCWLWQGAQFANGYGAFNVNRRAVTTHRFSYELHYGPIQKGTLVCHRCDVRVCVNPEHLFLGSHTDNMQDCASKGRFNRGLTPAQVEHLMSEFAKGGRTKRSFARELGVTETTVGHVLNGHTWRTV